MNNSQLSRAVDALYDCVKELKEIAAETIDHRDSRIQNIEASLDKLGTILYVEKDERPEMEKLMNEIVSEVQYLPKGSIVRENVLRLLGSLNQPTP